MEKFHVIGLMSGTSLDGIDAALIETDGEQHIARLGFLTVPYDDALRQKIRAVLNITQDKVAMTRDVEREITIAQADVVKAQPRMAPSRGWEGVRFELKLWLRCILACAILVVLIDALVAIVANDTATEPLKAWYKYAFGCVIFWFIFGPAWNLLLVRRSAR